MPDTLILGTRGSDLALFQANFIKNILETEHNCRVDLEIIKTAGDKIDDLAFDKMEGKGFFTKEIEDALLDHKIDLAVHSLKDLMTTQPAGLKLGAVGYRADRREMLLVRKESCGDNAIIPVREGGIIGTGSPRRKCQIAELAPSLKINDLRGNVPTRINKLRNGQYDAIIIAAAGVKRLKLDISDLNVFILEPNQFLPAPGQGILGLQIRDDDLRTDEVISKLESVKDVTEASLERGLLNCFDAGCSLPLGVYSHVDDKSMFLQAVLGIKDDNENWIESRKAKVSGNNVNELVDEAFNLLTKKE